MLFVISLHEQWISECQNYASSGLLDDWRKEKLTEGIELLKMCIKECEMAITVIDSSLLQQQKQTSELEVIFLA